MMRKTILICLLALISAPLFSQCFQVLDGNGVLSSNPTFISCTPGDFTIFIQVDTTIGPFRVDWGDGSPLLNGTFLGPGGVEQHTYTSTTDTFNIEIIDWSTGCRIYGKVIMERNPLASIQLPAGDNNYGCTPIEFRFINSSTQISQTTRFTWDFGDGSGVQKYNHTNAGDTIKYTYQPGIGIVSCDLEVELTAKNYCGTSTAKFSPLKVWDMDEARIDANNLVLCYPDTIVQYSNVSVMNCFAEGNTTQRYEKWNFGDYWGLGYDSIIDWRPWNPPVINPPPMGYPGRGTYTVTLIDSSYCGLDTTSLQITITDPPTAGIVPRFDTICAGDRNAFFNTSTGGATDFYWNVGDGQGWIYDSTGNRQRGFYFVGGNYTVYLAAAINGSSSCIDTTSITFYVNPVPTPNFGISDTILCDSGYVYFTDSSSLNSTSWQWDFGNGTTFSGQNPPPILYDSIGVYDVSLTTENAQYCSNTLTKKIYIKSSPTASFLHNDVCLGDSVHLIDQSNSVGDPITSYLWLLGNGDSSFTKNTSILYDSATTYYVQEIVSNGYCIDTAEVQVNVEEIPVAKFSADTLEGCTRLNIKFTNQSSPNAVRFYWNFGDGSPVVQAKNITHWFRNFGNQDTVYVVQLIAQSAFGCADTIYDSVLVHPKPIAQFTSTATLDCAPLIVSFNNLSQGNNLSYIWDFGDGTPLSNDTNPVHPYENKSLMLRTFTAQLISVTPNGCRDTAEEVITVFPEPVFTFASIPDSGCSPLTVTFPPILGAVNYFWDFDDGTFATRPIPTKTFVNNSDSVRVFNVLLRATNSFGCIDSTINPVKVFPSPNASFDLDTNLACQPINLGIRNTTASGSLFNWDFGDGTTSTTADTLFYKYYTNTSLNSVNRTITLMAESANGCRDTLQKTIDILPTPQADYFSDTIGCSPLLIQFTNQSFGATNFFWNLGNGTSSSVQNPINLYSNNSVNDTTFNIELRSFNNFGCSDTTNGKVEILGTPSANFSIDTNQACQPYDLTITNTSIGAAAYTWKFGDGTTSNTSALSFSKTYSSNNLSRTTFTIQLIVEGASGCKDSTSKTFDILPNPLASFTSDSIGCSPKSISFINQSIGSTTYSWDFGDGSSSSSQFPNHQFVNSTDTVRTFQVRLATQNNFGCVDTTYSTIKILPRPISDFSIDTLRACQPIDIEFINKSTGANFYTWNFGDGTTSNTTDTIFKKTYTNNASSSTLNTIKLVARNVYGCKDSTLKQVEVLPRVYADFISDTIGCSPKVVQFINQSVGANNFSWTLGDGSTSNGQNPVNIYPGNPFKDTTYNVQLISRSIFGCNDTTTGTVRVLQSPVANFSLDTTQACQPFALGITNNSLGGVNYYWSFGDGTSSTDSSSYFQKVYQGGNINRTTYNIQLIVEAASGCRDTMVKQFDILPNPIALFSSDTIGCSPKPIQFINQSVGAISYAWDFGDGNTSSSQFPVNVYNNNSDTIRRDSIQLIVMNSFGCSDTTSSTVEILPVPKADFILDTNRACQPINLEIRNTSSVASSYAWDFGDGTTSNTSDSVFNKIFTNSTYNSQVYLIKLVTQSAGGCSDSTIKQVEVYPNVEARFASDTIGCSPKSIQFVNQSIGAISYQWNFGDGTTSNSQFPLHVFTNNTDSIRRYTTTLIATSGFGCIDTVSSEIEILPAAIADFSLDTNQACQPYGFQITNHSIGATAFIWKYGDGTFSTNGDTVHLKSYQHTNPGSVTYNLTLVAESANGCKDSITKQIEVLPALNAVFQSDTIGCSPLFVQFSNQSTGATAYTWNLGNGSSSNVQNPSSNYLGNALTDTTYSVELITSNLYGCQDTANTQIRVLPSPKAQFNLDTTQACQPFLLGITNTSVGATNYYWSFGDGTTSNTNATYFTKNFTNSNLNRSTYNIQLIVESGSGCRDTLVKQFDILPTPVADFTSDSVGCSPVSIQFTNLSAGAINFNWDFGDGRSSTLQNPVHNYLNNTNTSQVYTVRLIASNNLGCSDTVYSTVEVYPSPVSSFNIDTTQACQPITLGITNNSTGANTYRWDFGDSTSSNSAASFFSKTYTNNSSSNLFRVIKLVAETANGCKDSSTKVLEVLPSVKAAFSSDSIGCSPKSIQFNDFSTGATNYFWDFGDGMISIAQFPNHTFINNSATSKTFRVQLRATNGYGCVDTASKNIQVFSRPTASFDLDTNRSCQPVSVTINNNSSPGVNYTWDFGDGTTSNRSDTSFTKAYTNTNFNSVVYTIKLKAETTNGCADSTTRLFEVFPKVEALFNADSVGCSPKVIQFNNQSVGGSSYQWDFGDGISSTTNNPTHTYLNNSDTNQLFQASLMVRSPYGCRDTVTQNITIYPKPVASFTVNDSISCNPLQVNFVNNSQISDTCLWDFGNGTTSSSCVSNLSRTYTNTTSSFKLDYKVNLYTKTVNGCKDTATKTISVYPDLQASFNADSMGCSPFRVSFNNLSSGATIYDWNFGDGSTSPARNPKHVFFNNSTRDTIYRCTLRVVNSYGCVDSMFKNITVSPKPVADFVMNNNQGCQPLPVTFTNISTIYDSCFWSMGNGTLIKDCSPQVQYTYNNTNSTVPVSYQAQLIVATAKGCKDTISRNVTVFPNVTADFLSDTAGCSPLDIDFRSQSLGAINYRWNFGDGGSDIGQFVSHIYTNTGNVDSVYNAQLIAESLYGCNDTVNQNITVSATPQADFDPSPIYQVYPNTTVSFNNLSGPGSWSYKWDFGDSTTSTLINPNPHNYSTWGVYKIKLVASSSYCTDSIIKNIEIDIPTPVADFGDSASGCEPLTVDFQNRSLYGQKYFWDFGDGIGTSTAENPSYTYLNAGNYSVSLRVEGYSPNKMDIITKQNYIQVYNSPRAQFSPNKDEVYIPNDPLVLSNTSYFADEFYWNFGDGRTSTERSPIHYYQEVGNYNIYLVAKNSIGCMDTFYLPLPINAKLAGRIDMPNAFTPNPNRSNGGVVDIDALTSGSNLNDVFYAKIRGAIDFEMNIYNRWGELIFVSRDPLIGWDGYYRGELCKQDVYIWKVMVEFGDGEKVVKAGDLMLLR